MPTQNPIIIALDVDTRQEALDCIKRLGTRADFYKIGLQLFSREGMPLVNEVIQLGKKVFLDLKLHDIPNTVSKAVRALARPGIELMTLHAFGGTEMMASATATLDQARAKNPEITTKLIGVTVLTSLDDSDLRQIGVDHSPQGQVLNLARLTKKSGLAGVVSSPHEARLLRNEHGPGFLLVTPGIRASSDPTQDQKRVMSAAEAIKEGSDHLVIGRSLLDTPDPAAALESILREIGAW